MNFSIERKLSIFIWVFSTCRLNVKKYKFIKVYKKFSLKIMEKTKKKPSKNGI